MESLKELSISDLGGVSLNTAELYSDELIAWVDNLNTDLGTERDPHYNEYKSFMDEINNAKIITLDASAYQQNSKYDELDLTGENEPVKDITDQFYKFMGAILFAKSQSFGASPYDLAKGSDFAPFTDMGLAPFDNCSVSAG